MFLYRPWLLTNLLLRSWISSIYHISGLQEKILTKVEQIRFLEFMLVLHVNLMLIGHMTVRWSYVMLLSIFIKTNKMYNYGVGLLLDYWILFSVYDFLILDVPLRGWPLLRGCFVHQLFIWDLGSWPLYRGGLYSGVAGFHCIPLIFSVRNWGLRPLTSCIRTFRTLRTPWLWVSLTYMKQSKV